MKHHQFFHQEIYNVGSCFFLFCFVMLKREMYTSKSVTPINPDPSIEIGGLK